MFINNAIKVFRLDFKHYENSKLLNYFLIRRTNVFVQQTEKIFLTYLWYLRQWFLTGVP